MFTKENIEFIRGVLPKFDGELGALQQSALKEGVPIIPHETARFLAFLIGLIKPESILEIGTAVGFSAVLFNKFAPEAKITTIDRYEYMIKKAKENFMGIDNIRLLEGDAAEILPGLKEEFDFIFLDAAKAQYINYLPEIMRLLKTGSVFAADDVLMAGGVMNLRCEVPRRQRTIHQRLGDFLIEINSREDLETSLLPIGGGLAVCRKKW